MDFPDLIGFSAGPYALWDSGRVHLDLSLRSIDKNITPPGIIKAIFENILLRYNNFETFFTDGSKTTNGVGCAIVRHSAVLIRYSLPSDFSIFSAELFAINLTIELINEENIPLSIIFTDSLSAIRALSDVHETSSVSF